MLLLAVLPHKTFQEVASFAQGKQEEVPVFDGIRGDLPMLFDQV